jgi:hypothetical protein
MLKAISLNVLFRLLDIFGQRDPQVTQEVSGESVYIANIGSEWLSLLFSSCGHSPKALIHVDPCICRCWFIHVDTDFSISTAQNLYHLSSFIIISLNFNIRQVLFIFVIWLVCIWSNFYNDWMSMWGVIEMRFSSCWSIARCLRHLFAKELRLFRSWYRLSLGLHLKVMFSFWTTQNIQLSPLSHCTISAVTAWQLPGYNMDNYFLGLNW